MTTSPPQDRCPACHHPRRPGARFCTACGLDASAVDEGAPAPAGATPHAAPATDAGDTFASQGQLRHNQTYVGGRLMFTRNGDVESTFANIVGGGTIWGHLKGVLLVQLVVWLVAALFLVPAYALGTVRSQLGGSSGALGAAQFFTLVFVLVALGLLVLAFTGWIQEPMSEWELLLDERSVSADSAYAAITLALHRRSVPADVRPQRIATDATRGEVGSYLVVSSDPYAVYVSVLPYGTGLYLAWAMWREQRVISLYAEWFRQLRNRWAGSGSLLNLLLRAEEARALRETVHNAVRDGVDAAVSRTEVDLRDAFGPQVPKVRSAPERGRRSPAPPRPRQGRDPVSQADAPEDDGVLTTGSGTTWWAWFGVRITAATDITQVSEYRQLDRASLLRTALEADRSYLAAQLGGDASVELRWTAVPGETVVRLDVLGTLSAGSEGEAVQAARVARRRLLGVPRHVVARTLGDQRARRGAPPLPRAARRHGRAAQAVDRRPAPAA